MFDPELIELSYHRNGVCGLGFHAVLFTDRVDDSEERDTFLATVFDAAGACAVVSLSRVGKHGVAFGCNSWRGDRYEGWLRKQIEDEPSTGSVRVGPFGLPTVDPVREAAPDLLAACEAALIQFEHNGDECPEDAAVLDELQQAIARAKGEGVTQ